MSLGKLEAAVVLELRPPDLRSCAVGREESCVIFFVLLPSLSSPVGHQVSSWKFKPGKLPSTAGRGELLMVRG